MAFTAESLLKQLAGFPSGSRFAVAYSGGLDSIVLLHAMHHALTLASHSRGDVPAFSLRAIHVNHGLSPRADQWQSLCEQTCAHLGVPLHCERITLDSDKPANLESQARDLRYGVFERQLEEQECLLMAHHLDDQAETFLLRSLRGAGPRGLAAVPKRRTLGRATVFRPLLAVSRAELEAYAQSTMLSWVEDESNANQSFDRNYCRHALLPQIEQRWPAYRESWQRSAALCAEADSLLDELALIDYEANKCPLPTMLNAENLQSLSQARQRNLLRYWLSLAGAPDPGWNILTQIVQELIPAAVDAQPEIRWHSAAAKVVLHRYRQHLYLHPDFEDKPSLSEGQWQAKDTLHLEGNGLLYAQTSAGGGLRVAGNQPLSLRYRQGGESCKLQGRRTRSVKKILQDANVVPWLRDRVPLLYSDGELICIPGIGVCEGWQAGPNDAGWQVIWVPPGSEL